MNKKPIISWYKNFDPTIDLSWIDNLTEINIINTKKFTKEFINICLQNKDKIFLHVHMNGMGGTQFEPNIPSVKHTFNALKVLVDNGFPVKQILLVINPILPNDNGLKAIKLLLKLLTEYKELRLRWIRFEVLRYKSVIDLSPKFKADQLRIRNKNKFGGRFVINNDNILKRVAELNRVMPYLINLDYFFMELHKIKRQYETIINIDPGDEPLIGIRELVAFGYSNNWKDSNGNTHKLITYENNNKFKPQLNIISRNPTQTIRCKNRCILCPYKN